MGRRMKMAICAALLALACCLSCGKPTGVPEASSGSTQRLPFDREPPREGSSPSQSLVPSTPSLPEGTSLLIKLQKPLSSASARAGESFEGVLDEPVVVEEQTAIARGARVTGRVLDAEHSSGKYAPGYLRITLVGVDTGGRTVPISTSSVFVKAGSHSERPSATGIAAPSQNDVVIATDRRLTFRLAQAAGFE